MTPVPSASLVASLALLAWLGFCAWDGVRQWSACQVEVARLRVEEERERTYRDTVSVQRRRR